jgi:hypothetical protein
MQKYLNEGTIVLTIGFCAFCYFVYLGINRNPIKGAEDLTNIVGIYSDHSFRDNTGYKSMGREYYIWIEGYSNRFQIPADYLAAFQKDLFDLKVKEGDRILVSFAKSQGDRINSTKDVLLTSVRVNGYTYLDKNDVLKIENTTFNSNSEFFIGLIFLGTGLIVYIRHRIKSKKRKPRLNKNA